MSRPIQPEDAPRALEAVQEALRANREPEPVSEVAPTAQPPVGRTLYRIVRGPAPSTNDFASNLAKCLPMRGAEASEPLLWAGLSMFDTTEAAVRNALRFGGRIGTHLAELSLPTDGDGRVLVRQTLRPGHFTVLCCDTVCIASVRSVQPIAGLSS